MTGSRTPPAAPSSGLLARYHHALPRLAVLLRGAELSASPDRWQNVYDLLVALNAQGRLPQQATKLEPLLAPLLCSSAREQQQFGVLFKRWLADPETDLPGPEDGAEAAEIRQEPEPPPAPRLRWWLIGLAALLAVLIAAFYWDSLTQQQGGEQPIPPVEPIAPRPSPGGEPPPPEAPGLEPQPVPPRTRLETPTLDAEHRAWLQTLGELLLLLPGFFALAWLLLRWLTWKTVLERRQGDPDDPLTAIGLDARIDDLLDAPALRDTLKRLHTPVAVPTRRLDAEATVACTARHAGLFQPVRRHRRIVPELVILIEQRHACDQMAGLAGQLVDRLRSAGLTVSRYDYRDSPRKVVGLDGRWRPLGEVASRHEGARLLLVGEPAALIDPFSEDLLSWTRSLAPWPERGLLVTRRPPERWQLALIESGFLVAELDSAGIQTIALQFADRRALSDTPISRVTVPLPRLLQDARRWVQPVAPATSEVSSLLGALDVFLDEDGTRLLTAMAAYPQLHWGLTRVLDLSLFPGGDPIARERRLLKVARLPWSRAGWLPDWLRGALLERLGHAAERDIRRLYRRLLCRETATAGGPIALPVSLPRAVGLWAGLWEWMRHKSWRVDRWLAELKVLSAEHATLNDAIFADILFGWHLHLLDFILPRRLLRRRMGGALGQALAPRLLVAALIAFGGAWIADRAWHDWGRQAVQSELLAMQNADHAAYRVTIWQRAATAKLAQSLKKSLEDDGFTTHRDRGDAAGAAAGRYRAAADEQDPMGRCPRRAHGHAHRAAPELPHLGTRPGAD